MSRVDGSRPAFRRSGATWNYSSSKESVLIQVTSGGYDVDGFYTVKNQGSGGDGYFYLELIGDPSPFDVNPEWNNVSTGWTNVTITLTKADQSVSVNVQGTYTVGDVTEERIYLSDAPSVSTDWSNYLLYQARGANALTYFRSPTLENLTGTTIGPFTIDNPGTDEVIVNFSALNGLYKDDGTTQTAIDVVMQTTIQPIDASGTPVGTALVFQTTLFGSTIGRGKRSVTGRYLIGDPSRCTVKVDRLTAFTTGFTGQVYEEVKWVDLYGASSIADYDFGDVTLVRTKSIATAGATASTARELNMLATRKIPTRISGDTFTTTLTATSDAAEILSFVCLDPYIGRRAKSEIDFDSIYDTVSAIETYFGIATAKEFNYTFDSDNLSFEETVATIATAIFSTAYRRGSQIKLNFEKETEVSTLLFNHRNKLPGSETRSVRFGNQNEHDGVEFEYVDPDDNDTVATFTLPTATTPANPKKVQMPGIRSKLQAHFQANRIWNKIQYQHIATEFEATQEADVLVLTDRVLVADNTRTGVQDGEVLSQNGLILELSQPVDLTGHAAHVIFLQYDDGTVDNIGITAGADEYHVTLASAPTVSLSLDVNNYARATYLIVGSTETAANAFIVTEKDPQTKFTTGLSAVNYDSRYYSSDKDYTDGIVDANGDII
jgi:hypothetical protein